MIRGDGASKGRGGEDSPVDFRMIATPLRPHVLAVYALVFGPSLPVVVDRARLPKARHASDQLCVALSGQVREHYPLRREDSLQPRRGGASLLPRFTRWENPPTPDAAHPVAAVLMFPYGA